LPAKTIWPKTHSTSRPSTVRPYSIPGTGSYLAEPGLSPSGTARREPWPWVTNGWQLNTISSLSSGTPFTVYDSADVSLQGSAPEISGFYSSRPNLISNPDTGQPHTPNERVSRAPFQQLNPITQAGQFGNEGRNVVRGPGIEDFDLSLI
jgi:hypothetical protein